jgi:hypothetical protein
VSGQSTLEALGRTTPIVQIRTKLAAYAAVTGDDRSLKALVEASGGQVDLGVAQHQLALLDWLRSWGCRHLRSDDSLMTANALDEWWEQEKDRLPAPTDGLADLSDEAIERGSDAYDHLRDLHAAGRRLRDREVSVVFGDTAAAKTLFAVRPAAFPPWDEPIRQAFGWSARSSGRYGRFLREAAAALQELASRMECAVADLPSVLGRPESTPAKIIDEYLWITVTRGL